MVHKCDRESCAPVNISGPKVNCAKCKNTCFLKCFGFEKGTTVDSIETVKKVMSDGTVVVMFLPCMAFVCCDKTVTASEVRSTLKMPAKRDSSTSKKGDSLIANEINSIKELLLSIKDATDTNTAEIAAIKSLTTKTDENVKKVTNNANVMSMNTPTGSALKYVNAYKARALARGSMDSPNKRQRTSSPHEKREKLKLPTPKVGTKANVVGLSVVQNVERKKNDKQKFSHAIRLTPFNPNTMPDDVIDYITKNTPVTDKSKMNVHKLVKKDADLSLVNFVSFKVELNEADYDELYKAEHWPKGVKVYPFVPRAPKITMGDHLFPSLNELNNRQMSTTAPAASPTKLNTTDAMEV